MKGRYMADFCGGEKVVKTEENKSAGEGVVIICPYLLLLIFRKDWARRENTSQICFHTGILIPITPTRGVCAPYKQ
jgi:hypothetical protein